MIGALSNSIANAFDLYNSSEMNYLKNLQQNDQSTSQNSGVKDNTGQNNTQVSSGKVKAESSQGNQDTFESQISGKAASTGSMGGSELSEDDRKKVEELKTSDKKVKAHESAHLAAAQGIAVSGANYQYEKGPDGVNYAVGGDVKIDTSKENDPKKTISKAQKIVTAALAPSDPSPQDRKVASAAESMEAQAQMESTRQQTTGGGQKTSGTNESSKTQSAYQTGKFDANNANNSNNTNSNKAAGTQTGMETEDVNSANSQMHPGIKAYEQNQSFAYIDNLDNRIQLKMNSLTSPASAQTSIRGTLNLVA